MIVRKAAELLRWISRWTKLPVRGILNILVPFLWNQLMYFGAKIIAGDWIHYDLSLPMDAQIPFVPWTVLIYFSWIVYWLGCDYVLVRYSDDAEKTDRFFGADVIVKTICFCIFLALPTTNVRPEITEHGLWDLCMRILYWLDTPDNLFPSIHCLVSWLCWIGIRKNRRLPRGAKVGILVWAVLICIATLTTKQHVIVDVFGGIVLAEVCYGLGGIRVFRECYGKLIDRLTEQLTIK